MPLEFLINGSFLRTSLDEYLTANGISAETLLTVEYVRALVPPAHVASFEHDDWVSSIDVLSSTAPASHWRSDTAPTAPGQSRLLTGSFDGRLRVWSASSEVLATSPGAEQGGHASSIKAAKLLSPTRFVSGGYDRTVRVWKYAEQASEEGAVPSASIAPHVELHGHRATVTALAVHAPSSRILSASDDHTVGFWSSQKSGAPAAPTDGAAGDGTAKRRKVASSVTVPRRGALHLLRGHAGPASGVLFAPHDATVAHSAGLDAGLRTWDLTTGAAVDARALPHPLTALGALPALRLLAAGTAARSVVLVDPRADAARVAALTLRGHANAVAALAGDPGSGYGLVSASHDGTCRVWDVRSRRQEEGGSVSESVYTIARESAEGKGRRVGGEGVKVFDVCWDAEVGIVSAGEDKRVQINRAGSGGMASSNA